MKISVIGAGNVGSLAAMRIAEYGLGEVLMVDIAKGLACGKALDLEDARQLLKAGYSIRGSEDISLISKSDIVVITAGLARKPGMTREDLAQKNAAILKGLCESVKSLAPQATLVIVTNPLDLMTRLALDITKFERNRVLGMGLGLDASRLANLIACELKVSPAEVDACVIASHGEGMLPLPRLTLVKGKPLTELLPKARIDELIQRTVARGAEIVSFLGSGSAYFAPSAAVASLVHSIARNEHRQIGVSAYLDGEYGVKGLCAGVPCLIGARGIEKIVEISLEPQEKELFAQACTQLKNQYLKISP